MSKLPQHGKYWGGGGGARRGEEKACLQLQSRSTSGAQQINLLSEIKRGTIRKFFLKIYYKNIFPLKIFKSASRYLE